MDSLPNLTGQVEVVDRIPLFAGRYSTVFKGQCKGEDVAIKDLRHLRGASMQTMRRKVRREREVWAALLHPNIVPLRGLIEDDETVGPFGALIMPFYKNGDTESFLLSNPGISFESRLALWTGVVAAVAYLHQFSPLIIHGDIKPTNILVDDNGQALLTDFGLSQIFLEEEHSGLTTTTEHTGTLRYLAPELIQAHSACPTAASDVYALACVGMEFLDGQTPYQSIGSTRYLLSIISKGDPPATSLQSFDPQILAYWGVFQECWTKPGLRPTATELEERLNVLSKEDVLMEGVIGAPSTIATTLVGSTSDSTYVNSTFDDLGEDFGQSYADLTASRLLRGVIYDDRAKKAAKHTRGASIFKGYDGDRVVAIKVIRKSSAEDSNKVLMKIKREMTIWIVLEHPNILPFYGFAEPDNQSSFGSLISPWCENGDLIDLLKNSPEGKFLTIYRRLALWEGVVLGVAYLHGLNPPILHRDIKPANIVVDALYNARICDFGVSCIDRQKETSDGKLGIMVGTARYMAPELAGEQNFPYAKGSDMYAVACTGLEIIFDILPHPDRIEGYALSVIKDVLKGTAPAARPTNATGKGSLESALWDIIETCWDVEPRGRMSALEVQTAISKLRNLVPFTFPTYMFLDTQPSLVPVALSPPLIQARVLMKRAHDLPLLTLQFIHLTRALYHLLVSWAGIPTESFTAIQFSEECSQLQIMTNRLEDIVKSMEEQKKRTDENFESVKQIQRVLKRYFEDLCSKHQGALEITFSRSTMQRLEDIDSQEIDGISYVDLSQRHPSSTPTTSLTRVDVPISEPAMVNTHTAYGSLSQSSASTGNPFDIPGSASHEPSSSSYLVPQPTILSNQPIQQPISVGLYNKQQTPAPTTTTNRGSHAVWDRFAHLRLQSAESQSPSHQPGSLERVSSDASSRTHSPYRPTPLDTYDPLAVLSELPGEIPADEVVIDESTRVGGVFADVYRATYKGRLVAIKARRWMKDIEPVSMKRKTERELRAWWHLAHENVLPLLGLVDEPSLSPYRVLVSPWCEYGSLADYMERNPEMKMGLRLKLFCGVTEGLNYLHSGRSVVVHGDLEPRNILIDSNWVPKLCGFGLVRIIHEGPSTGLTTTSNHLGVTRYLAPELFGETSSTPWWAFWKPPANSYIIVRPTTASDVHALGSIGMKIMTSIAPYDYVADERHTHSLHAHLSLINDIKSGHPPAKRPNGLSDVMKLMWRDVFEATWRKKANKRPTAGEVSTILDGYRSDPEFQE